MQVQEIKDVVSLGIGIAELVDAVADGVSLADIFQVVGVLKKVEPAVAAVKTGKLLDEYAQLDAVGKADLISWFDSEFSIKEANAEAVVEKVWAAILELSALAKLLKPAPVAP